MATAIINSQMDAINESFSKILYDLTTIRPLLKNASIGAYPTDTASGSIASFNDGADNIPVKSLSVDLEPVQDLNGYDNPWPAGGGKNLLNPTGTTTTSNGITFTVNADGTVTASGTATAQAVLTYSLTTLPNAISGNYLLNGNPTGASSTTYRMRMRTYSSSWSSWIYANNTGDVPINNLSSVTQIEVAILVLSGQTVSNIVFKPMLRLATISDDTFAPYENICPISGHTEVNVYRTGKNLWNPQVLVDAGASESDGVYNVPRGMSSVVFAIPVSGQMAFSYDYQTSTDAVNYYFRINYTDGTSTRNVSDGTANAWRRINLVSDANKTVRDISLSFYSSSLATQFRNIQLELGSTATDYEPYTGQTYNVPLGQTVYGGTLNVTTGVLTIDKAMVDLGTLTWVYRSDYAFFYTTGLTLTNNNLISSAYIALDSEKTSNQMGSVATGTMAKQAGYPVLLIKNTAYTDAAAFKTAMSGVQLVYELATPTTVQLTATQVSTLLGANNIWADAGEVEVTYRADTGLYINKMIANAMNA